MERKANAQKEKTARTQAFTLKKIEASGIPPNSEIANCKVRREVVPQSEITPQNRTNPQEVGRLLESRMQSCVHFSKQANAKRVTNVSFGILAFASFLSKASVRWVTSAFSSTPQRQSQ